MHIIVCAMMVCICTSNMSKYTFERSMNVLLDFNKPFRVRMVQIMFEMI